ncbi:MAG TPA: ATP-dependent helicase [Streptosporangiaceae bacterium]|nr:ATP-dependent helicase [Streptosporangiaceae bacterium]
MEAAVDGGRPGAEAVLDGLDPEQREAALAARGPVCVLAGAGTGKTRAITHRIAYAALAGLVDPARVLALTFTVRAAGELRGRLRQLGGTGLGTETVRATTFHSAALRQLTYFWPRVVGGRPPRLAESKLPLLSEAVRVLRLSTGNGVLADVAAEIEWAKVNQVRPDGYAAAAASAGRPPGAVGTDGMAALYDTYERLRRERQLIDFESVLELTAAILAESRQAADQVRASFRYFVVDEYQDVNPLQKLLLDVWLGDRDDLCVVGDPHQTIYSFTGATHRYLTSFTAEFPDATVVRLIRDYRSTPQVVALANQLVSAAGRESGPGAGRGGGRGAGMPAAAPLVAQRPPGPEPVLAAYDDELAEAEGVTAHVRSLIDGGVPAREIAVLVRINAMLERFEHAFSETGVPYQVRGSERFYERPEVRQAIMLLRGALRGTPAGEGARPLPAAVRDVLSGLGLTAAEPAGGGTSRQRWESLAAIAQLADDMHATRPGATLGDFTAELQQRAALGHAPAMDSVTLASMHAAKGLEWDAVILPGLVEGVVPIVHAQTPEAVEEERRLLYVAVTRARERLFLSWAAARAPGGRPARQQSRFLPALRLAAGQGRAARAG